MNRVRIGKTREALESGVRRWQKVFATPEVVAFVGLCHLMSKSGVSRAFAIALGEASEATKGYELCVQHARKGLDPHH
jgi:hypothetical protein